MKVTKKDKRVNNTRPKKEPSEKCIGITVYVEKYKIDKLGKPQCRIEAKNGINNAYKKLKK